MKSLKMIGLAALAATALMALSAGTASATVFCKNNTSTEACTEKYPVGTVGLSSLKAGTTQVLETLSGTVLDTCTGSSAEETLQNEGSATETITATIPVGSLKWGTCTKTTDTLSGGEGEIHWIAGTDNGTITAKGFEVTANTIFGSCIYGLGTEMKDWGTIFGGAPGKFIANAVVTKRGGSSTCPAEVRVTGEYVNTKPEAGYVAKG